MRASTLSVLLACSAAAGHLGWQMLLSGPQREFQARYVHRALVSRCGYQGLVLDSRLQVPTYMWLMEP